MRCFFVGAPDLERMVARAMGRARNKKSKFEQRSEGLAQYMVKRRKLAVAEKKTLVLTQKTQAAELRAQVAAFFICRCCEGSGIQVESRLSRSGLPSGQWHWLSVCFLAEGALLPGLAE